MPLSCKTHSAMLFDRGGITPLGSLGPLTNVEWERKRDDVSEGQVFVARMSEECVDTVDRAAAGRSELVIYRGQERVWEGPITHLARKGSAVEITARDVTHYVHRTIMRAEYDNSFPNVVTAIQRVDRILRAEMARKEAQDPPVNVIPYLTLHETPDDARTTSHTLPFEATVFAHMDQLAARGGMDYVVVGRALHLFDVDTPLGRTNVVTAADFIGDPIVTEYGMELATFSAITDGLGNAGTAGGADPYYGLVEILDFAYDEDSGEPVEDPNDPNGGTTVTVEEMTSQAERVLRGKNPVPVVVRVPDGSTLNPNGTLSIKDLVPGVWVPLQANLSGRSITQMQKLDYMKVTETPDGEEIKVTLSPAPQPDIPVDEV